MPDIAITTRNVLTEAEQNLLEALTDPRSVVSVSIPDSAPAAELFANLELCCRAYLHLEKIQRKIGPIIGRILLVLSDNPDRYQSHGYATFEDFLKRFIEQKMGYSRSSAYQSMRLVRKFPGLALDTWRELGVERIQILSKFTQESDPSFPKYLARARQSKTKVELLEWASDKKLIEQGEHHMKTMIIHMSRNLAAQWRDFRADGRVHSVVGSELEGVIFEAMLAECSSGWLQEDIHCVAEPVVVGIIHGLCGLCKAKWQIGLPAMVSLHDMRGLMHDYHKEASPHCEEGSSNLIIHRPGAAT